jgi:D-psicose/D-tagatose/L-ribulose 3-epimerase
MKMKFGVTTFIWTADFGPAHFSLLPRIKAAGFDGIEAPIFNPKEFPAAEIRKCADANGLECTTCTVCADGLSLISEDADVRRKARVDLEEKIQAAAEAGSHILAGPVYGPVGYLPGRRRTEDEWKWAVESYQSAGDTLAACGVTLAIEPLNRFETYFLNTAADAAALCDQVGHPNVGILFDTFHANIEEKNIAAGYRTLGKRLKHVHTCENDRGTPGSGHVEWPEVFQALRDIPYDGWAVIEGFGFAQGPLSAAASIWRDIETTPETVAFEGVRFLRRNLA